MSVSAEKKRRGGFFKREFGDPERRTAYYMVLPALLIILIVAFFPIMYAVVLSLTQSTVVQTGAFVGFANYVEMFQNPDFLEGLTNTVVFTVVSVTLEFLIGLGIALAINQAFRGRGLVRAAILVPWAFPTVISAVMWRLMFQDQVGVINYVVNTLGIISQPILSDRTLLLIAAIGVDVWKTTPFMALLLLAGITLPLLKGTILVAVLFRTLDSYRIFDLFWAMSNRELESLSTFVYKSVRVSQLLFAQGNAASVFIFVTSFLLALFFIYGLGMQTSTEE